VHSSTITADHHSSHLSAQTSVLFLQRKSGELEALESAASRMNDYDVFMALANHIGHDKRGNVLYVRDAHGNEIVTEETEQVREYEGGRPVIRHQKTLRKVKDDNTHAIAMEFRGWLSTQD